MQRPRLPTASSAAALPAGGTSAAAAPRILEAIGHAARRLEQVRPAPVLGVFVVVQWLAVLALALTVRHNGWLYFQGGDQLWHYTSAWLLAHGQLPPAPIAYGWATTLLPIAGAAGPNLAAALPAILLLDGVVLLPVALLCVYGIGARIGGRLFGYWTAALWIAMPFLGILYTAAGYHQKYTELTLPQALGLSAMSDFPSVVFLLVSAYFVVRVLDRPALVDGLAAGVAASASLAIKPSNALFLLLVGLALLARRRVRELVAYGLALVPFVLVLALWKQRGLGSQPLFAFTPPATREAIGVGGILSPVHRYLNFDWHHLNNNFLSLQEHFWSLRLLEALVVIGIIALARRSAALALLVGGWFVVFLLAKGTYRDASVDDASFLRLLLPAAPAFVLLVASIPLLAPGAGRIVEHARAVVPAAPRRRVAALAALGLAVFAVYPAAVIASAAKLRGPDARAVVAGSTFIGIDAALAPRATVRGAAVELRWRTAEHGERVFYRITRARGASSDLVCKRQYDEPDQCTPTGGDVAVVRRGSFVDRPGRGSWTYRVGVLANWLGDATHGDVYVLSRPLVVDVR